MPCRRPPPIAGTVKRARVASARIAITDDRRHVRARYFQCPYKRCPLLGTIVFLPPQKTPPHKLQPSLGKVASCRWSNHDHAELILPRNTAFN